MTTGRADKDMAVVTGFVREGECERRRERK